MHIICEYLHDLYTLNSLSGWKGLTKFIPKDCLNSTLIYILFSLIYCDILSLKVDFLFQSFLVITVEAKTLISSLFQLAHELCIYSSYLWEIRILKSKKTLHMFLALRNLSIIVICKVMNLYYHLAIFKQNIFVLTLEKPRMGFNFHS